MGRLKEGEKQPLTGGDGGDAAKNAARRKVMSEWLVWKLGIGLVVVGVIAGVGVPLAIQAVNNAKKSINPAYTNAAIATENEICSELGVSILKQNGSAVDAAITSTLCIGVVNPQSSGIGGGGFMLVYDDGVARTIDFREMAPAASSLDMYTGYSDCMSTGSGGQGDNTRCPSRLGGLAVGVPGELLGLERAHKLYGRLPWSQVVGPVAELCRSGFPVSGALASSIRSQIGSLMNDTLMAELFAPRGVMLTEGQIIVRPRLAATLEQIAARGSQAFYTGEIAEGIVSTVANNSFFPGILTADDLANYSPIVGTPLSTAYGGFQVYSLPPPGSGGVLMMALNILEEYNLTCANEREFEWSTTVEHRLVEAMKYSYAERTQIADPCCGPEDGGGVVCDNQTLCALVRASNEDMLSKAIAAQLRAKIEDNVTHLDPEWYALPSNDGAVYAQPRTPGTTHISVIDGNSNQAVAVTSTVNLNFGAKIMTQHGIILNNEMDDFSSPGITNAFGYEPAPANFIEPYKRPLSSSAPTVVVDGNGQARMALGASGGSKIITAVLQVVLGVVSGCANVRDAVDRPRLHHQLQPMHISGEASVPANVRAGLEAIGHWWNATSTNGVCHAVVRGNDFALPRPDADAKLLLYAASDYRRKAGGASFGY